MSYFTKQFSEEVILPDGNVATSAQDIERFLKANNLASKSDYSQDYLNNLRRHQEKLRRQEIWTELLQQYKKRIWND